MTQKTPELRPTRCAEVAVSLPVWKTFTYGVPPEIEDQIRTGKRVLVPFQRRKVTGYVLAFPTPIPDGLDRDRLKEAIDVLDETPLFDEAMLSFFRWISNYYVYPLGEVIRTGLPPGLTLRTCRILKITSEGKAHLAELSPESEDHRFLQILAEEGAIRFDLLFRRLKIANPHARLFSLKKKNLLIEELRLKPEQIKPRIETFVGLPEKDPFEGKSSLTPKEREILRFIRSKGRVSRKDIQTQFPKASPYIGRLAEKGWIALDFEEVYRDPFGGERFGSDTDPFLTPDQQKALSVIDTSIAAGGFRPFLLHGITGSGKTEVYLRTIQRVIQNGKAAIVLVPEISLTPQLISRFKARFREGIAVLHSGLSPNERYDQWRQILKGEVCIAIGARSAIFAPFRRLGIIIVDEEHEVSFKQEEKLKYNARDLAVMRAKMNDALLILGSATPSIESFFNTQLGKFHYLRLPQRVESRRLPFVEIVDMRLETKDSKYRVLSDRLKEALLSNGEKGRQSLLFLNRRGFANFILCRDCGWTFPCPNCSVTYTYHAVGRLLQCHHCGLTAPTPPRCPQCEGYNLHPLGIGTQRVENEIIRFMPSARIARMDRDTTTRKGAFRRIVHAMESGEIDILVGTQMIVKGHDFPKVTLVGIICADTILHFPDFRAAERTFQLLTQAAGRAGRGDFPGRVIIQTYNPDHYSIQMAKNHDFLGFYGKEIFHREELGYPPFSRLANLRISGTSEVQAETFAKRLGILGAQIKTKGKIYRDHLEILGPCRAPLARVKGKYRWQLFVKSDRADRLHWFIGELVGKARKEAMGVHLDVDVDPINLM
jgi:primosomal protein N' (replication factor Y)